jgi:acetoin utilization deacetylase AcuC-like enzyme
MHVYYSPTYVSSGFGFDTTRKAGWIADSVAATPIPGVALIEPEPLTAERVMAVHAPEYVRAIETGEPRALAESQMFDWDAQLWPMVLSSNGGVVAAAFDAMEAGISGSLSSGLHHARRERGAGYCTFNGLAIAAREVVAAGARSVLILDLDAHCGGGTASLIADEPRIVQADVSVDRYDCYTSTSNAYLSLVTSAADYLPAVSAALRRAVRAAGQFDLCIYNAGMDPVEGCSTGGLSGVTVEMLAQREQVVFDWAHANRVPIAFVLAGGYIGGGLTKEALVQLHRLTIETAAKPRS